MRVPTEVCTGQLRRPNSSQRRAHNLLLEMVSNDRAVYQEEHAAQLIMARRLDPPHKGRIHLRRPVIRSSLFPCSRAADHTFQGGWVSADRLSVRGPSCRRNKGSRTLVRDHFGHRRAAVFFKKDKLDTDGSIYLGSPSNITLAAELRSDLGEMAIEAYPARSYRGAVGAAETSSSQNNAVFLYVFAEVQRLDHNRLPWRCLEAF